MLDMHNEGMGKRAGKANTVALERAARMKLVQVLLHGKRSQRAFAAQAHIPYTAYNNWFTAYTPLSADGAKLIKDASPGVTVDWLLYDDRSGLTAEVLRKLQLNLPDPPQPLGRGRPGKPPPKS